MAQDGLAAFEPAYVDELAVMAPVRYAQRRGALAEERFEAVVVSE
jgi:hypothetical protein